MIYIVKRSFISQDANLNEEIVNKIAFDTREKAERFAVLWAKLTVFEQSARGEYELLIKNDCRVVGEYDTFTFTVEELVFGTFFD